MNLESRLGGNSAWSSPGPPFASSVNRTKECTLQSVLSLEVSSIGLAQSTLGHTRSMWVRKNKQNKTGAVESLLREGWVEAGL